MDQGVIKPVTGADLEQAFCLEKEGYPPDEAASPEALAFRQAQAPSLFVGYYLDNQLIGLSVGPVMMESGWRRNLCQNTGQMEGVALALLRHYTDQVVPEQKCVKKVLLICKSHMMPLYTKAGFSLFSKSRIVLGEDPWYEMGLTPKS